MYSTQQAMQSAIDLQANAQEALPILPNNGNPAGANNMPFMKRQLGQPPMPTGGYDGSGIIPPHMRQQPGQPPAAGRQNPMLERYPWLKPTSSMDNIREWLSSRRGKFGQQPQQPQPQLPQLPHQPTIPSGGIISMPVDPSLYPTMPAIPVRAPQGV